MVCVVTVDVQHDFLSPVAGGLGSCQKCLCLPGVLRLLQGARASKWPVVHVLTEHDQAGTKMPLRLKDKNTLPFCVKGTPGARPYEELVRPEDATVIKCSYSGFVRTDLEQTISGFEIVVLCGLATDCCLLQTAFDAAERCGKRVVVPFDATAATERDRYLISLCSIAKSAGIVLPIDSLLSLPAHDWTKSALECAQLAQIAGKWFDDAAQAAQAAVKQKGGSLSPAELVMAVNRALGT